jgi:cysteine desulfurase
MRPHLDEIFGNSSSVEHEHGHIAAQAVELAREQVAAAIGANPNEIIFTGSCTEANNLALLGAARAEKVKRHIITSAIEHPAVLEPLRFLEQQGWHVSYLPVDEEGRVSPAALRETITSDTFLVSIMAANNEVGTVQAIEEIGTICSAHGVLFHSDLAQIISCGDIDVARDGIHMASLSAHKVYGPKGIGALYLRSRKPRARISPIIFGGGQERGFRSGTLNTMAVVGMGKAFAIAKDSHSAENSRLRALCSHFSEQLQAAIPGTKLNGSKEERIANNLSFSIDEIEPLALIRYLRNEISFSASSACASDKIETSYVLKAMFGDTRRARGAFRIAPGRFTTAEEMDAALELIVSAIRHLRGAVTAISSATSATSV